MGMLKKKIRTIQYNTISKKKKLIAKLQKQKTN